MKKDKKIKVILADDHRIMREGLRSLLEKNPEVEVVAETEDGRSTVEACNQLTPDLVVMDITMPDLNGIEATRKIISEHPEIKVIGLSIHSDRQFVNGMLKAGASGYLLKACGFRELSNAIDAAVKNDIYLSPSIAKYVVSGFLGRSQGVDENPLNLLTAREKEVFQLLAEGKTRSQISDILYVSPRTIETHRRQLMEKLGIKSTAELVKIAIREGLISIEN